MPWSSRTPSPIPWFSMLSMWSVRGRGDAGCPYAGALPTLPLGARGSGGTEVLARVCGPAGTGVLARVCGCTARSLGARGPWHVCAALEACAGEHWQIVVSHCPARGSWLVSLALQPGDGEQSANFVYRTVLRSTRKKFGPFSGASLLSVFSPQEQQQRQQSRSVRSAWCRCRGLRRRRRRRRRPCSGQRGLESQARAL